MHSLHCMPIPHQLHLLPRFSRFAVFVLVCAFALTSHAQSRSNANRYRMMLRSLDEQTDTSQTSKEKLALEESRGASVEALEGKIDPQTYVLGAGDELLLTIRGQEFSTIPVTVLAEGNAIIQNIGEFSIAGLTISSAESLFARTVAPMYRDAKIRLTLLKLRKFRVYVTGFVQNTGVQLATPIDRVSSVIERAGGYLKKGHAYLRKIAVNHRDGTTSMVDQYPFWFFGDNASNPVVQDGDVIHISTNNTVNNIYIYGEVGFPGEYQFAETDSFSSLIRYGQGLLASAFLDSVEVARFDGDGTTVRRFYVNCSALAGWDAGVRPPVAFKDFPLQRGDQIFVREMSKWHLSNSVALAGEVKYPGRYAIQKDTTTLSELISRARGFTDQADLEGVVFVRRSTNVELDREFERLQRMIPSEMTKSEYEYFKAKSREHVGVMVVDFKQLFVDHNRSEDITLRDEDSIYVPSTRNYVSIIGSVNIPGRIIYNPLMRFEDYIQRAGGYGLRADASNAQVIKTRTGEIFDPHKSTKYTIDPGDTIFVPEETEVSLWPVIIQSIAITSQVFGILLGIYAVTKK